MLKIPSFRYFKDQRVTAYQDDLMWWKFYLIPDYVSIRRDAKGDPVFLLIKYAFSDEDRARNSALPVGAGFMVFDVELTAAEENVKVVTQVLQNDVNDIWNQMKALAEGSGQSIQGYKLDSWYYLNGHGDPNNPIHTTLGVSDLLLGLDPAGPAAPPGDKPPTVILDMPTWTEGTFQVSAPQSAALVSHTVSSGKVSLLGNNVASANMDLTDAGATFMQKTLLNPDGMGASDLTPIQVTYDLKYWARVPPVHILVTADSRSLYEATKSIYHNYEDNSCTEDVMTHAETNMTMAVNSGLVKVSIDAGTLPLTGDFIQQLSSSAQKFVTDQVKSSFFTKAPPDKSDNPSDDKTKDFVNSDEDIYYLKTEMDFTSVHIGYETTAESIVEWPAAPQGTLQSFFAGMSAEKMTQFVRVVDLEDPFFQTLNLTVTAFANWDQQIDFVECQVRYNGEDENNKPQEKVQAFTFTKDHTSDTWDPRLLNGNREYEYRWRVGFNGREPADFNDWQTTTAPKLNIDVGDPGHLQVKVLAGNVNFADVINSIQVDLDYGDDQADVPEESTTVILDQKTTEQDYDRWIYAPQTKPVRFRPHFFLKTGQAVDDDWQETTSSHLVINEPSSVDKLEVNVLPVGNGWANVSQVIVDLNYQDTANHYTIGQTLQLKTLDEFRHWVVVLKDNASRNFQYKYVASFKDGSPPMIVPWTPAQGNQTLPIMVRSTPELSVTLFPQLVDFTVTPLVEAELRYDDSSNGGVHQVESFVFKAADPQTWGPFPISDASRRAFRYQLTYHQPQAQVAQAETTTDSDKIVISALPVPKIMCLIIPKLVDFNVTPVVEVDVSYTDSQNGLSYQDTLVFTEPTSQQFQFQVAASSPRSYQLTVTYYLANGGVVVRDPVTLDRNQVVIPRYVPAAG